jgi:addiction module HigA family antidote
MATMQGLRMKNPAHPGGFVRSEVIEPLGLSVTDAAHVLGVTRPALSALLNERAHLSADMALRIEKAFGVSMDTLMRMQNSYDIARAGARRRSRCNRSKAG